METATSTAADPAADPLLGTLLDGRYRIERRVARGGMATVYAATDQRLDRTVALKILHAALAEDPEFVARFEREARTAARLSHPHVVSVHDQGESDGRVFLVMEYVEGRTLRDLLVERGRLSPSEALDLLVPALEGLAAAHAAGLVHRDVKPENVLLAADGRVKVADFGLTRAVGSATAATQGVLIGTVAYLAPEQVARGIADSRSDVYAAGVLLFEMLTGRPPYTGDTPLSVAYQHVHETIPAPSSLASGIPSTVDALVTGATRPDPDDRPADAAELLGLLRQVRADLPNTAPVLAAEPGGGVQQTLVVALPDTDASQEADQPRKRRRRWPWLLLLLILVGALSAAAWYLGSARYTTVPTVLGLNEESAAAALAEEDLTPLLTDPVYSETVAAGLVVTATPAAGEEVRRGSDVELVLSKGPERYEVPALAGKTVDEATKELAATNLIVGETTEEYSNSVPEGQIISITPAAGTSVKRDTPVALVVSQGLPPVKVPNVVGSSRAAAESALKNKNLTAKVTSEQFSESVAKGAVISQSPAAGKSVDQRSTVSLVISKGPPLVAVPNVLDRKVADATAALEAAGFRVKVNKPPIVILDRVLTQSPGGGTQAPKGSTITITAI